MNYDEQYFRKRMTIEHKHYFMTSQWVNELMPKKVLDVGCGVGHYVKALRDSDVEAYGVDISRYAIENTPHKDIKDFLSIKNITSNEVIGSFDLVLAVDILEHLEEHQVEQALKFLRRHATKHLLCSIPFIGDPNLEADVTHKIFKTREWWVEQITKAGFVLKQTPNYFYYPNQILIFKVKK